MLIFAETDDRRKDGLQSADKQGLSETDPPSECGGVSQCAESWRGLPSATRIGGCSACVDLFRGGPSLPGFSQVFILKVLKVVCFHTLLQVFILKVLTPEVNAARRLAGFDC